MPGRERMQDVLGNRKARVNDPGCSQWN